MKSAAFTLSLVCWSVFYVFWVVAALMTKRTASRESFVGSISYRIPAILAFMLLVEAYRMPGPWGNIVIGGGSLVSLAAMFLSVVGLLTCVWARVALGRNWSSLVVVKVGHELVQNGPYRFVRHPIYTGMLMMFLANVVLAGRMAGFLGLLALTFSFVLKLKREEAVMLREFPESYPSYMKRVKRLVPFVV